MATLEQLEASGILSRLSMPKVFPQKRQVWIFKELEGWFRTTLPTIEAFYPDEITTPMEQAWTLLARFIRGETMFEDEDFRLMKPNANDIYELRTPDLRFFGWFTAPRTFLVTSAATFADVHAHDLHAGYMTEAIRMRDELDLDHPKYIVGALPQDVL